MFVTNTNVTWTSSNTAVAGIITPITNPILTRYQSRRMIEALTPGTATITVTTADGGHTATCNVTVLSAPTTVAKMKTTNATVNLRVQFSGSGQVFANGEQLVNDVSKIITADAGGEVKIGTVGSAVLTELEGPFNNITTLDVSGCTGLQMLNCGSNGVLNNLNVSGCTELKTLYCDNNSLNTLDVSGCTKLQKLHCYKTNISILNLSGLTQLQELFCYNTSLSSLNVSGCTALDFIRCYDNKLSVLNLSGLTSLKYLECERNNLNSLNISGLTSLIELGCTNNKLSALNVSGLTSLERLGCSLNNLSALNVSGLTHLEYLFCNHNNLSTLNVSGLTSLKELHLNSNNLSAIDVSGLMSLIKLDCAFNNNLTALDVSGLTSLKYLNCQCSKLSALNVSGLTSLERLYCDYNNLSALDVSGFTSLIELWCQSNKLHTLNLSGCTALNIMYANNQTITVSNSGGSYKNPISYIPVTGAENIMIGTQTYAKDAPLTGPVSGNTLDFTTNKPIPNADPFSGTLTLQGYTPSVAVAGVTVAPPTLSLAIGATGTLTETVSPADATNKSVTWNSSNTSVATVSATGVVTAVSEGDATITVMTVDGNFTADCEVEVSDPNVSNDNIHSTTFSAYPNPTSGMVTVTGLTAGKTIKMYRITGALVGTFVAQGAEMTINIDNLSSGMYFLTVEGKTIRIIKN